MIPNKQNNFEDIDKELNRFLVFIIIALSLAVVVGINLYAYTEVQEQKEIRLDPTHKKCVDFKSKNKRL